MYRSERKDNVISDFCYYVRTRFKISIGHVIKKKNKIIKKC